ncbi:hypothetical protein V2J09_018061 [Rumex salicifolius]
MANPIVFDHHSSDGECDVNFYPCGGDVAEHHSTPLAFTVLIDDIAFPDDIPFPFSSSEDLEFKLDDLEFIDDLHFDPGPGSNCVSSDHFSSPPDYNSCLVSPEIEVYNPSSVVHGLNADLASNFGIKLDSDPPPMAYDTQHANSERDSSGPALSNQRSNFFTHQLEFPSPASENCDNLSFQGSGEINSGVSTVKTPPSPNSGQSASHFSSSSHKSVSHAENFSTNRSAESKIKIEEAGRQSNYKRRNRQDDGQGSAETRASKFIKSSIPQYNASLDLSTENEPDDKKNARLTRNRESAHLSRQRKKEYVEVLEDKVKFMNSTITDLNRKVSDIMAENATLRQKLSAGVVCPPPPLGMYPMAPMSYPWMPYPAYIVKPQGSHVPLVPIPRLKPQQPGSASKASKKSEYKKNVGKTKKVASVSFLGMLFFIMLFGGLFPVVHFKYGDKLGVADHFSMAHKGRIFMLDSNIVDNSNVSGSTYYGRRCKNDSGITDGQVPMSNSSEPLAASLFVPKNEKLVKIDGNLIIHSVLASERARASPGTTKMKTSEETRLAIARNYVPSYQVTGPAGSNTRGSHLDDGRLQQWFHDDLSGSMLSSGMCTEVFQFDVSPTSGSVVPVSTITNTSPSHRCNSSKLKNSRNRRILSENSIPVNLHALNFTDEHAAPNTEKRGHNGNKSRSSMVVSVLIDPRETGEGDVEDVMRSKSLSRILVVVLIDGVKYVTYSCMLPFMGSSPHSHLVKT